MEDSSTPNDVSAGQNNSWKKQLTSATPLSRYLTLILFVALPFVGFWLGLNAVDEPEAPETIFVTRNIQVEQAPTEDVQEQMYTDELDQTGTATNHLPLYRYDDYSDIDTVANRQQVLLSGMLTPLRIESAPQLEEVQTNVQCLRKDMLCLLTLMNGKSTSAIAGILKVEEWTDSSIIADGAVGDDPSCEQDAGSCYYTLNLAIDRVTEEVRITDTSCYIDCAVDEYLLVGEGDGKHETYDDLPEPVIEHVPII